MTILAVTTMQIFGWYLLYNAASKSELRKDRLSVWLRQKLKASKVIGYSLLSASLVALAVTAGFGAGLLTGIVLLMAVGCLIVFITPFSINNN